MYRSFSNLKSHNFDCVGIVENILFINKSLCITLELVVVYFNQWRVSVTDAG